MVLISGSYNQILLSDATSRWAGWALAHPEFGSSVNPITTRGADYAHLITTSPSGFENPVAALYVDRFIFSDIEKTLHKMEEVIQLQ